MSAPALRRVLHAASAAVLLLPLAVGWPRFRVLVTSLAIVAVFLELARLRLPRVGRMLTAAVPVFRPGEALRPSGAFWLSVGYACAAWFPAPAAAAGILVGATADPAAAWIGSRFGRKPGKSWSGSLAALAAGIIVLAAAGLSWRAVVAGGVVGAALERWCGALDDNLLIAPGVALVVLALA